MRVYRNLTVSLLTTMAITWAIPAEADDDVDDQVQELARFFQGSFFAAGGPPLTMDNCEVTVSGLGSDDDDDDDDEGPVFIHLQQAIAGGPLFRIRLYEVAVIDGEPTFAVRSYVDPDLVTGICDLPASQRVIDFANVIPESCNVPFMLVGNTYEGSNFPEGCPSNAFGAVKVTSDASVSPTNVTSLDRFFAADGTLLFGSPISFDRISPLPPGDDDDDDDEDD